MKKILTSASISASQAFTIEGGLSTARALGYLIHVKANSGQWTAVADVVFGPGTEFDRTHALVLGASATGLFPLTPQAPYDLSGTAGGLSVPGATTIQLVRTSGAITFDVWQVIEKDRR